MVYVLAFACINKFTDATIHVVESEQIFYESMVFLLHGLLDAKKEAWTFVDLFFGVIL